MSHAQRTLLAVVLALAPVVACSQSVAPAAILKVFEACVARRAAAYANTIENPRDIADAAIAECDRERQRLMDALITLPADEAMRIETHLVERARRAGIAAVLAVRYQKTQ